MNFTETYTAPSADIVLLQNGDVLTSSGEWTPGENETERAGENGNGVSLYPTY